MCAAAIITGLTVAVLALQFLADKFSTVLDAMLTQYDGNVQQAELEATAENVISVLENHPIILVEIQTTAKDTQKQVQDGASKYMGTAGCLGFKT